MAETLLISVIIAASAFFTGRKFYRQWRAAIDKRGRVSCGQGCCSCSAVSNCATKDQ